MANALPESANLDWLKKTAKQRLRAWKAAGREAPLAEAQLAVAREYGFSSWRALKAALEAGRIGSTPAETEKETATFLLHVGQGHLDEVGSLLKHSANLVNAVGPHPFWGGRPQPLHVAIETTRREMVDLLLEAGADVDGDNALYEHWSPVMLTVSRDLPAVRQDLIERGATIGLLEALLIGDDARVEHLLKDGAAALPRERPSGSLLALARTPFAIDALLDLGVSPDGKDQWGSSAIETLSRLGPKGRPLVLRMMQRGITAEPQEFARLGDLETLGVLCAANPEIARDGAVFLAAIDFGHREIVEWLLARGADINARNPGGAHNTGLHSAAWNGDMAMVRMLVENGADITALDNEYETTPQTWAEVAIEVTDNQDCAEVAAYLKALAAPSP
ncbi:MAG: ankyrin repeat domain-containing protein [Pseudomonadota bacterium]